MRILSIMLWENDLVNFVLATADDKLLVWRNRKTEQPLMDATGFLHKSKGTTRV